MSKISYLVEFSIHDGKTDQFKEMASGFIKEVKAGEPGTLGYNWHLQEDGNRCLIREEFASSEDLMTHLGNVGPSLPSLLAIAPLTRCEVFGEPSDTAREALGGLGAVFFSHFDGFSR